MTLAGQQSLPSKDIPRISGLVLVGSIPIGLLGVNPVYPRGLTLNGKES